MPKTRKAIAEDASVKWTATTPPGPAESSDNFGGDGPYLVLAGYLRSAPAITPHGKKWRLFLSKALDEYLLIWDVDIAHQEHDAQEGSTIWVSAKAPIRHVRVVSAEDFSSGASFLDGDVAQAPGAVPGWWTFVEGAAGPGPRNTGSGCTISRPRSSPICCPPH